MSQSTECARVGLERICGAMAAVMALGVYLARLAVVPGTTHVSLLQRAEWLATMVTEFLDVPMAQAE